MPIVETATEQVVFEAIFANRMSSNAHNYGPIIDSYKYEKGLYFTLRTQEYSQGNLQFMGWHSDTPVISEFSLIPEENWIYPDPVYISYLTQPGMTHMKQGYRDTKRYIRPFMRAYAGAWMIVGVLCIATPAVVGTPQGEGY